MSTRGLRKIAVDGIVYQWKADWTYRTGIRTILLRVWGGDKTSQALHADMVTDWIGFAEVMAAARERGETLVDMVVDTSYVMPSDVRAIIEYGLVQGWDPRARGKPFVLTLVDRPSRQGLSLTSAVTLSKIAPDG